jgi:cytokinesis protein
MNFTLIIILFKLIDTKGTSKSTTLLHFLVDAVEKNFPNVLVFLEELDECGSASKGIV